MIFFFAFVFIANQLDPSEEPFYKLVFYQGF